MLSCLGQAHGKRGFGRMPSLMGGRRETKSIGDEDGRRSEECIMASNAWRVEVGSLGQSSTISHIDTLLEIYT